MDKEKNKIKKFVKNIKRDFYPCKILLFGSRAKGDDWRRSDYDVIVISDKFENTHWLKRISLVLSYWDLPCDLDVLPYTFREFKHKLKESSFVREIVSQSKNLI